MNGTAAPERQWLFRGPQVALRPGRSVELVHVDGSVPVRRVVLRRRGAGADPVRYGESIWLDDGDDAEMGVPLDDDLPPEEPDPPVGRRHAPPRHHGDAAVEALGLWRITGGVVGTVVPLGVAVGLLNDYAGDHLVAAPPEAGPGVAWWAEVRWDDDGDLFAGRPPLPLPTALRAVAGVPNQVHLAVRLLAVATDELLVRVDEQVAALLAEQLSRRGLAELFRSPDVVARISGPGPDRRLPPTGTPILITGVLVLDEGTGLPALDPVDGVAWACGDLGDALPVEQHAPGWAELAVTWNAVAYPRVTGDARAYAGCSRPVTWYLPLPRRDGEPGSTTTFASVTVPAHAPVLSTPLPSGPVSSPPMLGPPPTADRSPSILPLATVLSRPRQQAVRPEAIRPPGRVWAAPASAVHGRDVQPAERGPARPLESAMIVRHPVGGGRALRMIVPQPEDGAVLPDIARCTVRVHARSAGRRSAWPG